MGRMLMKRDHVLKIVLLATLQGLTFHGSATPFALYNTSMIAPPLGASPNFYSPSFTPTVSLSSRCMMVCRHNSNSRPNRSPFSTSQLESHFGRYRHKYEYLVPTLKFVSSLPTFFTNFLQPLSWEELEAREGSLDLAITLTCSTFRRQGSHLHRNLPKPNKKTQELLKSPSSLVFYSLSSSALPTRPDNPYAREGRVFSLTAPSTLSSQ